MFSVWQVVITLCVVSNVLGTEKLKYKEISDPLRVCLASYGKPLKNEVILGRWYYVYKFALIANLVPTTDCRKILLDRPNEEELTMYKKYYNSTGMPYSFNEDLLLYSVLNPRAHKTKLFDGLLIGGREAKFFLSRPKKYADREAYDVKALRHIDDNYMVLEDCHLRGNIKWLISKKNHPSVEELQKIISSQSDLKAMESQKYCEEEED